MNAHELPPFPCYLNGSYTRLPDAKVSVMDRGFIFGDGVYEVVPVYAGRPFLFERHMARLARSLGEVRIPNPHSLDEWRQITHELIAQFDQFALGNGENGPKTPADTLVYLQITRGIALRDHVMPQDATPTVFAMVSPMKPPAPEQRAQGVACVTADDFRWQKAHIKSTSLLGAVLARQISADVGAVETVMFRDGYLSEAAASNVWVVREGTVLGPPRDHLVLEGIRYSLIEEIARARGIPVQLRRISKEEVRTADEVLLSSATKEVLAVTTLDGQPVGKGRPGPVYAALYAGYQQAKQEGA
jgi:D-alanine transaminase